MIKYFSKSPNEILDFGWDWSAWLNGDTIASVTVTADSGITIESVSNDSTSVTAVVSGGTSGNTYEIKCKIVTNGTVDGISKTAERSLRIRVADK